MNTKDLMPGQPVTEDGKAGSAVLMEIIQRQNRTIKEQANLIAAQTATIADHEARITALEP